MTPHTNPWTPGKSVLDLNDTTDVGLAIAGQIMVVDQWPPPNAKQYNAPFEHPLQNHGEGHNLQNHRMENNAYYYHVIIVPSSNGMNRLIRFLLSPLFMILVFGQTAAKAQSGRNTSQSTAVVQSLYRQVIARHPLGIPSGENWKVFAPFLSRDLIRRITMARSCQNDWVRQNKGQMIKEPFAWGESGFFSGAEELSEPSSFQIQRTESNHDGSFHVYVKLTEAPPNEKPWSWDVVVQVKMEERRPVIEDVVYLKGDDVPTEHRLSEILMEGCNGSHWIRDSK